MSCTKDTIMSIAQDGVKCSLEEETALVARFDAEEHAFKDYLRTLHDKRAVLHDAGNSQLAVALQDIDAHIAALQSKRAGLIVEVDGLCAARSKILDDAIDTAEITLQQIKSYRDNVSVLSASVLSVLPAFSVPSTMFARSYGIIGKNWTVVPNVLDPVNTTLSVVELQQQGLPNRHILIHARDELGNVLLRDSITKVESRESVLKTKIVCNQWCVVVHNDLRCDAFPVDIYPQFGKPFTLTVPLTNYYQRYLRDIYVSGLPVSATCMTVSIWNSHLAAAIGNTVKIWHIGSDPVANLLYEWTFEKTPSCLSFFGKIAMEMVCIVVFRDGSSVIKAVTSNFVVKLPPSLLFGCVASCNDIIEPPEPSGIIGTVFLPMFAYGVKKRVDCVTKVTSDGHFYIIHCTADHRRGDNDFYCRYKTVSPACVMAVACMYNVYELRVDGKVYCDGVYAAIDPPFALASSSNHLYAFYEHTDGSTRMTMFETRQRMNRM